MPFTRRQLRSITQSRGHAYIARDRGPYSLRVAETYIRRKLYAWEDQTIHREYRLFQQASKAIRSSALEAGDQPTAEWGAKVREYAERRLTLLGLDVLQNAVHAAQMAYYAGYIGRLWVLDSMTIAETPVEKSRMRIRHPLDTDALRIEYDTALMKGIIKLRSHISGAVIHELPMAQAAHQIADLGQKQTKPEGLFYYMQLTTRSAVMRASNHGAYDAFMAQVSPITEAISSTRNWVLGMMWLSARDERVCQMCRQRDGHIWLLSELWGMALTELPPDGSHYGCRCGPINLVVPNFMKPETEPPDQTFDEWALENGYLGLLDEFLGETDLTSTQIGDR